MINVLIYLNYVFYSGYKGLQRYHVIILCKYLYYVNCCWFFNDYYRYYQILAYGLNFERFGGKQMRQTTPNEIVYIFNDFW